MWVIEEYRRSYWARISQELSAAEAAAAVRVLQAERPWRAYRLAAA